ncbi:MAG: ATP-binding protein [Haloferacaceae archaeon]
MREAVTVALLAPPSSDRAETAAGLDARDEFSVRPVAPDEVDDVEPGAVDVAVVFDTDHCPSCWSGGCVPVVLYGDDPLGGPHSGRIAGYARRGDVAALADQLRWVVRTGPDARIRLEKLHSGAAGLVGTRSREALYERVLDIAERVLAFDNCDLLIVEDGEFVSKAARGTFDGGTTTVLPLDHGLLGETYRTGESHLVRDVQESDRTQPVASDFRAGISVPFGDVGVLQAVSTKPSVFDETDVRLLELLTTYAAEIRSRIDTEVALREKHDRLSALFDNVPDAAIEYEFVDGDPVVRAVNDAFVSVFGYDRDAVVGESLDGFLLPEASEAGATVRDGDERRRPERPDAGPETGDGERASALDTEAMMLTEKLLQGQRFQHECRRRTANGCREFLLQIIPLNRDEGSVAGYAIYTDISEQKERERALRHQNDRLEEFASLVSHDLRNPLGIAQGHLRLARETGREESFETIEAALDRMDRLIGDVLSLARQGRVVGDPEPVNVAAVARSAWNTVETTDARLRTDGSITVPADQGRLRELFENLFRNSVEHGSTGSRSETDDSVEHGSTSSRPRADDSVERTQPDVTVTVEETADGFAVVDDGPGVPEGVRDSIFESGFTSTENGTGFGLAIVDQIATAHGWSVELAASGDGEGARFEIRTE